MHSKRLIATRIFRPDCECFVSQENFRFQNKSQVEKNLDCIFSKKNSLFFRNKKIDFVKIKNYHVNLSVVIS